MGASLGLVTVHCWSNGQFEVDCPVHTWASKSYYTLHSHAKKRDEQHSLYIL